MKAHNVVIHTRGKVPVNITDTVASGSVATTMEKRVPVRLCNFSTSKVALPKGACLGVFVEARPEEPPCSPEQNAMPSTVEDAETTPPLVVGRVATISDLPDHLRGLVAATSETLSEEQQQRIIQLLLTYQSVFAKSDYVLGYLSAVTHKIDTGPAKPVRQPLRRAPLGFQGEEEAHLREMLTAGVE